MRGELYFSSSSSMAANSGRKLEFNERGIVFLLLLLDGGQFWQKSAGPHGVGCCPSSYLEAGVEVLVYPQVFWGRSGGRRIYLHVAGPIPLEEVVNGRRRRGRRRRWWR